jgi:F0F1-type ATP synthase assembly protein I
VTGWIAAPIIIALFLGKYLDNKYQTEPWIFLGLTALSFVISCVGIVRITIKYTKKIESELKEKQDANNSRKTHE